MLKTLTIEIFTIKNEPGHETDRIEVEEIEMLIQVFDK